MTPQLDRTYRKEKLLDWERKSLSGRFSAFSPSKKSTWVTFGFLILGLSVFGLIVPFLPPRFGSGNWTPATTNNEYQSRLTDYLVAIPILVFIGFAYISLTYYLDLKLGIKRTANFKITEVLNIGTIKILFMNGWRPLLIRAGKAYFKTAKPGQIITIKRTGTFKLIDYYIRDEKAYIKEQEEKKASN